MPLIAELGIENVSKEQRRKKEEITIKTRWDEEAIQKFKDRIAEKLREEENKREEGTIEEKCEKIKEIVKDVMVKKERRIKRRKIGYKDWWDRGCTKEKRKIMRAYRKWKRGKGSREEYIEEKKIY